MPDKKILSEANRAKLDGIVQKMVSNKESDETIRFVVDDFKSKYGQNVEELKKKVPSDGTGQPSQEASSTRTDRTRSLSGTEKPQGQKASGGSDGEFRLPTEEDFAEMQRRGDIPVESLESYVGRSKRSKEPLYNLDWKGKQTAEDAAKEAAIKKRLKQKADEEAKKTTEEKYREKFSEIFDAISPESIVRRFEGTYRSKEDKEALERLRTYYGEEYEEEPLVKKSEDKKRPVKIEEFKGFSQLDIDKLNAKDKLDLDNNLIEKVIRKGLTKRIEDADLKVKYYESTPFNDNKYYSKRVQKPAEYDPVTQTYITQEPYDGFIEKYYNTEDLKNLGVDLDDFDGFLERRGLKQLIKTRVERGDFEVSPGPFVKEVSYEQMRSSQLTDADNKATSKQALIKRALDQYIKEKEFKNNDYKTAKKISETGDMEPVYEALFDRPTLDKYVEKNLPNLNKKIQEKRRIDEQDYADIVAKNGNVVDEASYMIKNIYRNVSSGFGDRVTDMISTVADAIGNESGAEAWRDYKYLEELSRPTKKLAGIESNLKKVIYDNREYGVDSKGNIYDVDAEVLVNQFLMPNTAEKIIEDSKKSNEYTNIIGVQGLVGDFAHTMTDMAVQVGVQALVGSLTSGTLNELLLARNITALRNAGIAAEDIQKARFVASRLKDAKSINSITLAEAGVSEAEYLTAQKVFSELKALSSAKASDLSRFYADFSKTTKIPITKDIGDAMIAQGLMGYSSGYEQTLNSAREAGISEDKAKELAETSAKLTSALYAITTPIQPNVKIKEAIFGGGIRSSINSALNAYKTGGINGFKNRLISGLRVLHEEGKKEFFQENVQQIGEIYGVNDYINQKAGTKLAQDEYSFNDFLNTSILSYGAGGLLPGVSAGIQSTSKQNVLNLYNLGENINQVSPVIDDLVKSGKVKKEDADKLKREAIAVHRNSTKIPSEVPYENRVQISVLLEDINDLEEKKKNVDTSFHEDINKQIEEKRAKIKEVALVQPEVKPTVKPVVETKVKEETVKPLTPDEISEKQKETESKIKRKDLFEGVGEFSLQLGNSDKAAVPISHNEKNGIEFVQYAHPETGSVDVVVTGKSDNDFVGFYRIYENGKPTNKWSSKFENQSRNKEDFKTMISGVQELLPEGHEYTEKTSISTDGLRVWEQQLSKGYELQYDENGNIITNTVAINGDAIVNELGVDVNKGQFENIRVTKEEFEVVKKAILPYLERLGLNESNIRYTGQNISTPGAKATVQIDLPVLKSSKNKAKSTKQTAKETDVEAKKSEVEKRRQEDLDQLEFKFGRWAVQNSEVEAELMTGQDGKQVVTVALKADTNTGYKNSPALSGRFDTKQEAKDFIEDVVKPKLSEKINAKYDAELADLEKSTKQAAKETESKNSLSLFQEISDITSKPKMQEFSKQNPDVAFIHNNIEGIIKGIDGAKVVEC